ncbi:hypothetical protein FA95DRAFT_672733 [Auriscalpium vulgare]|uniref:Uncharacterized protein n=1 Tax=Auriscalpium vulgare TaxID=40419 RepID=A0ACB8RC27_9AGAM|nr:hypothetical protein FA95DRAFT_672733 [Auriscalpium vulgare]
MLRVAVELRSFRASYRLRKLQVSGGTEACSAARAWNTVSLMHPPASHGAPKFAQRSMNPEMGRNTGRHLWVARIGDEREGEERGEMRGNDDENLHEARRPEKAVGSGARRRPLVLRSRPSHSLIRWREHRDSEAPAAGLFRMFVFVGAAGGMPGHLQLMRW